MKRLFSVAVLAVALTMTASESKAQSAAGMGPGMIYHADYKGASISLSKIGNGFRFIWACLSMKGAGMSYGYDDIYVDKMGLLHLPQGATITNDTTGEDVTAAFRATELTID